MDAATSCTVTPRISAPSVMPSAAIGSRMMAAPYEFNVTKPVSNPSVKSAAETPEML